MGSTRKPLRPVMMKTFKISTYADDMKLFTTVYSKLFSNILQFDLNNLVTSSLINFLTLKLKIYKKLLSSRRTVYQAHYFFNLHKLEDADVAHSTHSIHYQ